MESNVDAYPKRVIVVRRVRTDSGASSAGLVPSTPPNSDTQNKHSHRIKRRNPAFRVLVLPAVRSGCLPNKFSSEAGTESAQQQLVTGKPPLIPRPPPPPIPRPPPPPIPRPRLNQVDAQPSMESDKLTAPRYDHPLPLIHPRHTQERVHDAPPNRQFNMESEKLRAPTYDSSPPPIYPRHIQDADVHDSPTKRQFINSIYNLQPSPSTPVSKQNEVESVASNMPEVTKTPINSMTDAKSTSRKGTLFRNPGNIPSYTPDAKRRPPAAVRTLPSNEGAICSFPSNRSLKKEPEPIAAHLYDDDPPPPRHAQPSTQKKIFDLPPPPTPPQSSTQEKCFDLPPPPTPPQSSTQEKIFDLPPPPRPARSSTQEQFYDVPPPPRPPRPPKPWTTEGVYDSPRHQRDPRNTCDVPTAPGISPPWTHDGVYKVPPTPKPVQPWTQEGVYDTPRRAPPRPPPRRPMKTSMFQNTEQDASDVSSRVRLGPIRDNKLLNTVRTSTDVLTSIIDTSNITQLTRNTFKDFLSARDAAVVMFYHPSDKKFQQVKDQYVQASKMLFHHNHAFASVDCSEEKDLCRNEHITSYPAFKLYNNGVTMKTIQETATISAAKIQEYIDKYSFS